MAKLQRSGAAAVSFPLLPPAFQLVVVDAAVDAFERARRMAPRGLDDGTVYWTDRGDRLRLAVALEPEAPLPETLLAAYVLMVATGDALGSAPAAGPARRLRLAGRHRPRWCPRRSGPPRGAGDRQEPMPSRPGSCSGSIWR